MSISFDSKLLEKYSVQGPRYTSYPTAPEFNSEFSASDYLKHIGDSNSTVLPKALSLYIHVPFCHSLCYYCGCNKVVTQDTEKAKTYLNYLYREIELLSPSLSQDRLVTQIHFGGGTPNYLESSQFREILDVIARNFHLSYPEDLEISIEVDPRYLDGAQTRELVNLGFNRFSIGVQDYNHDVQTAINRVQSREQVDTVINEARDSGVKSISVDLISGLPLQTRESFADTLAQVVESGVDRIAIYNFAYLPQRIRAQKMIDATTLPSRDTRLAITEDTLEYLSDAGYVHIGMDHFAKPEDPLAKALEERQLKRNFQGYATHADCDQIGLGVSAISQIGDAYIQNDSSLKDYYNSLDSDQLPIKRGISLTQDDLIRADVIQQIMCRHSVDYKMLDNYYQIDSKSYFSEELEKLKVLEQDGLLELNSEDLLITSSGRFFLRNIAMVFDHYLQAPREIKGKVIQFSKTI